VIEEASDDTSTQETSFGSDSFDFGKKRSQTLYQKDKSSKQAVLEDFKILKVLGKGNFGKV
jgi:hypothetical protein